MEIVEKIKEMAQSHLQDASHFVVDVILSKYKPYKVTVILDGDKGITIDDCTELSRKLSEELDTLNLISDNYTLEVGTPGLDQPLKLKRQYVKNVGRELKVVKKDKSVVQGLLTNANEDKIVLQVNMKEKGSKKATQSELEIHFNDIEKALVMVSFK
jgi:ribosome maturation factor RimP